MSVLTRHLRQYIIADDVIALGALQLPYISGSVPVKSNTAVICCLSIVSANYM
jgi:hypothetical protein